MLSFLLLVPVRFHSAFARCFCFAWVFRSGSSMVWTILGWAEYGVFLGSSVICGQLFSFGGYSCLGGLYSLSCFAGSAISVSYHFLRSLHLYLFRSDWSRANDYGSSRITSLQSGIRLLRDLSIALPFTDFPLASVFSSPSKNLA